MIQVSITYHCRKVDKLESGLIASQSKFGTLMENSRSCVICIYKPDR